MGYTQSNMSGKSPLEMEVKKAGNILHKSEISPWQALIARNQLVAIIDHPRHRCTPNFRDL